MRAYFKILLFLILNFLCYQVFSAPVSVAISKLRVAADADKTRLVFDTKGRLEYRVVTLERRVIVDIKKATFVGALSKSILDKSVVTAITKIKNQKSGNLRLVLCLKAPLARVHHFLLKNPNRLVLDLYRKKSAQVEKPQNLTKPKREIDGNKKSSNEAYNVNAVTGGVVMMPRSPYLLSDDREQALIDSNNHDVIARNIGGRDVTVVIDPGHGGHDPGTIGRGGAREKDVTLAVARALQHVINGTKGFRAVLTRKGDYFISLRGRLKIAHRHRADVFISIHADADPYRYGNASGVTVFALSQRGATSEAARWLAQKENESELGHAMSDKNTVLRSVLIDLAQTATISASLEIGRAILRSLSDIARLHLRHVEQAGFVVLKSPDIPSLLVEVGFLSHKYEESKLRDPAYQREIALRLASGIETYFRRKPPHGTYLSKTRLAAGRSAY